MQLPIVIDLKPSPVPVAAAALLLACALCSVMLAGLPLSARLAIALMLCLAGAAGIDSLRYGRAPRALRRLEWLGDQRWLLQDGAGRCAPALLARGSRRLGGASLLIFRRGVFRRRDRPWILVLPNMVSDASAARRLRARLTLDGARMRGMEPM